MERQRKAHNLIIFLTIHLASSSNQNLYTFTTAIDVGSTSDDQVTDYVWLQPLNTTISTYSTTAYPPVSTTELIRTEKELDSSKTNSLNQYAQPSDHYKEYSREDGEPEEPPDHVIAYSEHEETKDVPTRPKYVAPGIWAKPSPNKNIPLDFVPTKLHAQVRGTHTVKRLPQRQAIENAENDEERRNAHRLREVVVNSKVNTVYTEEGYEDSAYDHAGHVRDADFHEGFAHKLHNQRKSDHNSSSGKKKGQHRNLVAPDEFQDYDEDYQDHLEESRKLEKTSDDGKNLAEYGRNIWEGSEIDPKLVAEEGIHRLEADIEKDAEETEKSSQIIQNAQESKLHNDVDADSFKSEESHDEDDLNDEKNKSTKTEKKIFRLKNAKADIKNKGAKQSHKLDKKKKLHRENYETTVVPLDESSSTDVEIINPQGFVTSPSSPHTSVNQTGLRHVVPMTTISSRQVDDEPTTISYSQLFWNYFKAKQAPPSAESSARITLNSTTINPRSEERTPIAVATIDGYGPYLLVTKEKTTMSPATLRDSQNFRDSFTDHAKFGIHNRHLLEQSDDVNYTGSVLTTTATLTSVQPFALPDLSSTLNPEVIGQSSSTTLPESVVSSNTPATVTINIIPEAFSRIVDYQENPFLSPILDNSNIAVVKNKIKYKVLVRPEPKKDIKPVTDHLQSSSLSTSEEENEYKRIRDELNAKYKKMLPDIKNKQKIQSHSGKKKIFHPEDLTLMRPPTAQQIVYSIFPIYHSWAADKPSVSIESGSPRVTNWRSPVLDQRQPQPIKLPLRADSYSSARPAHPIYHKNPLPATKLLPPPPPPPPPPPHAAKSTHADYHGNRQNDYLSYIGGEPRQQPINAFRYFPLVPEVSQQTRSRRKRSDANEFRAGDVKAAANNGVTNDGKSERHNEGMLNRVIGRSREKLSSWTAIDSNATKLASPARSRAVESGTSAALTNKTTTTGESTNAEETGEMAIGNRKVKSRSILIQSEKQKEQENNTNADELARKTQNVSQSEMRLRINSKNRVSGRDHEELLNEAPKISGDVIDEEIAARFNEKDHNETLAKVKEKGKVEVEVPNFDYVDELAEDSPVKFAKTTEAAVDTKKYPFYNNENVPSASALKYVIDPRTIPRKTWRGMEFYNSRNAYKQCGEVEPNLDEVPPKKEEPDPERGSPREEDLPRLRGLGDKLDCFKAKYFDENPLDNPLFAEKSVVDPTPPSELDPAKFAAKIQVLPAEKDEYVVHRVSKKPERDSRQLRTSRNRQLETQESIRVNYKYDPQTGRGRNAYLHTVRGMVPLGAVRRTKNRRSRPRNTTTTQPPKFYQTASYQNQVYEDVMGNIRNLASQIYETTVPPPPAQILATAGSEKTLKIVNITPSPPKEKSTSLPDVTEISTKSSAKSSDIRGLLPPPKYSAPRPTSYRKHRPPIKSRVALLRSSKRPRIIAHTIKIKKRSATNDTMRNSSESVINMDEKTTESAKVNTVENDTIAKSLEETTKRANSTLEALDLEIAESRQISTQSLSTILKAEKDKKRRRSATNSDRKDEVSPKIVYTIKDRIRYSKPKWNMTGFGKFNMNPRTVDEDNRRKEPRYNHFRRKEKPASDRRNNSTTLNLTDGASQTDSATSLTEGGESSARDVHRSEESVMRQMIYRAKDEYPKSEKAKSVVDNLESEESLESEEENEEEIESTTNTYQVHENIEENIFTTTESKSPTSLKEVQDLEEYLKLDPPGYAEAFSEEATTLSSKNRANMKQEEANVEQQDGEAGYSKNTASSWDDDSSEKAEEQVETPTRMEFTKTQDDDSKEFSSKEEESTDKKTFFTYKRLPSLTEKDEENGERPEKASFYRPFRFSRYKSKFEKGNDDFQENGEEKSDDYVFPWHADKEDGKVKHKWLENFDRFEYPWERRERLAKERRKKRERANRIRKLIFGDENEEESRRHDRPVYPWEKYDIPAKSHVNARRDIPRDFSRRNVGDREESSTEQLPSPKFSSRYSSGDIKSTKPSQAREISRSIKKFLEEDIDDESKEESSEESEDRSPSFARKSFPSDRGISRRTLVPEDVTQLPRKKNRRRKIPQANRNVPNNKSIEVTDGAEEEPVEYFKLNSNDSESQLSNNTTEVPGKRKKRRRKISKDNFTTFPDNMLAESITEPTKRRRKKPQASTTTSATPTANLDLETSKSVLLPVRKRYSKTGETGKTNGLKSFEKAPAISKAENPQETSTPKTRTIEHRSRVSKEKIVTKIIYPSKEESFNSAKTNANATASRKEPTKKIKIKLQRRKKKNNEEDASNRNLDIGLNLRDKEKLIKSTDEELRGDLDDEIKKSVILEKSEIRNIDNPLKNLEMKKDEVKKINDFSTYDGINDENDNDSDDFRMPSETYAVSNLLRNVPPNRADKRTESSRRKKNWKQSSREEASKSQEDTERRGSLQAKFIKNPERRLYYYIERKR